METILLLIGVTAVAAVISLAAFLIGWLLTAVVRLPWEFRPFNCRPCLTFWLTFIFNSVYGLLISTSLLNDGLFSYYWTGVYAISLLGFLLGLISFFVVKSKYKINE